MLPNVKTATACPSVPVATLDAETDPPPVSVENATVAPDMGLLWASFTFTINVCVVPAKADSFVLTRTMDAGAPGVPITETESALPFEVAV